METAAAKHILSEIQRFGPMGVERFIELALFDEAFGYYGAGHVRIGQQGDFITAPHMSRLFAASLANLAVAADAALGSPNPFYLVEGGPGEGRLALELLNTLQQREPALYERLVYVPDETSPALRARQSECLSPHAARVGQLPLSSYDGLYLSNELVDAFPVHRIQYDQDVFRELLVNATPDRFFEIPGAPVSGETAREIALLKIPAEGGWKLEVNLKALQWLEGVATKLRRGYVVTIDYGDVEDRLYGPQRPEGTLRAYRCHRIEENPFLSPGETDITASVNFSALIRKGRALGLGDAPLMKQRDFLFALGLARELARAEAEVHSEAEAYALRQELWPLLFGGTGMGETFKVLVQAKDAPLDALPLNPEAAFSA